MKPFYAGLLGGAITIIVLFVFSIFYSNYHLYNIKIVNPTRIDACERYSEKMKLINDMERDGILLTPQEYTNYIITYYNTAITILVSLFILFSVFSFFHFKFATNEQIHKSLEEMLRESRTVEQLIMNTVSGKADEKYASSEYADSLDKRISVLENDKLNDEIDGEVNNN